MEEITEAMETIDLELVSECADTTMVPNSHELMTPIQPQQGQNSTSSTNPAIICSPNHLPEANKSNYRHPENLVAQKCHYQMTEAMPEMYTAKRRSSCETTPLTSAVQKNDSVTSLPTVSPFRRLTPVDKRNNNVCFGRQSSTTTSDSGLGSTACLATFSSRSSSPIVKSIGVGTLNPVTCDKSVNSSPSHVVSVMCSPIETQSPALSASREYALKQEIDLLQERLKDTEERLESFRLQYDTLSQLHRKLRDGHTHLQDETEMLKLDVQHLNECANVLRAELQTARTDRDSALELQKLLQKELDDIKLDKKRTQEQKDKDMKTIQDLQRQCREMERILMRKHPDSVSALIGKT